MMNVSGIKSVDNRYNSEVVCVNTQTGGDNRVINAHTIQEVGRPAYNSWVPWADNIQEFAQHHISVAAAGKVFYIYQKGPYVWGSYQWFEVNAQQLGVQGLTYMIRITSNFEVSLVVTD